MINILRAEAYRFFKSKSYLITQIILVIFAVLNTILPNLTSSSPRVGENGVSMLQYGGFTIIEIFILPILLVILNTDLTKNVIRNTITLGETRKIYFIGKLVSLFFLILSQVLFLTLLDFLSGTYYGGVGDMTTTILRTALLQVSFQVLILLAIGTLATIVLYLTRSSAACVFMCIVFPILVMFGHLIAPKIVLLNYVDFLQLLGAIKQQDFLSHKDVVQGLIGAGITVAMGSFANTAIFYQQDL